MAKKRKYIKRPMRKQNGTGPYGKGAGPGKGKADGTGLKQKKNLGGDILDNVQFRQNIDPSSLGNMTDIKPDGMGIGKAGLITAGVGLGTAGLGAIISNLNKNKKPGEFEDELGARPVAISGKNTMSTAMSGAALGTSIAPGIGTVIGGLGGAAVGAVTDLVAGKKQQKEYDKKVNELKEQKADENITNYLANKKEQSFKDGGKVKGKKGIDNIDMDAEVDGFVVPKKNASKAMDIGKIYLGWNNKQTTSKNQGNIPIKISAGEVYFTRDEANALRNAGVDINSLAPDAMCKGGKVRRKYNGGGGVKGYYGLSPRQKAELSKYSKDDLSYLDKNLGLTDMQRLMAGLPPKNVVIDGNTKKEEGLLKSSTETGDGSGNGDNKFDYKDLPIAEALSIGQIIAGAGPLIGRKDKHKTVPQESLSTYKKAIDSANYGMEPEMYAKAKRDIEQKRIATARSIGQVSSSPAQEMGYLVAAGRGAQEADVSLEIASQQIKTEKERYRDEQALNVAEEKKRVEDYDIYLHERNTEAFADLMNAGIENLFGAISMRDQIKRERERDKLYDNVLLESIKYMKEGVENKVSDQTQISG